MRWHNALIVVVSDEEGWHIRVISYMGDERSGKSAMQYWRGTVGYYIALKRPADVMAMINSDGYALAIREWEAARNKGVP
jgi:hypothetical protein